MTLDDLTEQDRESLANMRAIRAMGPGHSAALTRLLMRICNDVEPHKAWALFWREATVKPKAVHQGTVVIGAFGSPPATGLVR